MKYEYHCFTIGDITRNDESTSGVIKRNLSVWGEKGFRLIEIQKTSHVVNDVYIMEKQIPDGNL